MTVENEASDINEEAIKRNVSDKDTWLRLVYMIILGIAFYFASSLLFAIALLQFLAKLFTGKVLDGLMGFSVNLGTYLAQIAQYLAYNNHDKPFPFAAFPETKPVRSLTSE
jgi:hypothetical protein